MASAAPTIALIGAGRMGAALARGWLASGKGAQIRIIDPSPSDEVAGWAAAGKVVLNPPPAPVDIAVLAVKPQMFDAVAQGAAGYIGPDTLVLSIMAGVLLKQLAGPFESKRLLRAMPNTPGAIGRGITVIAAPPGADKADIAAATDLLAPLGDVEGPVDEKLISAVTGVSGSGPAYVFLLAEVMAMAGEAEGLPADLAARLARKTVEGAAALMAASDDSPDVLRKAVTSPGGTTQAALDILMDEGGMPVLMRKAIRAAAIRERDLSRQKD
ncbi:pyrroline-5-carboxylate reductase [Hyphomonas johnsonii]|uniref:Pyrroline-5-carboxylate reductase n=1 Tax=Hyphomonas johnsonii MHS-2 TaxID=1280950 RepID=A0A059FCK1_9PROT|nr:pyrroline-5-carboxylate reductase [Hyphomonas johnsonii]KCZ88349.1 pyrroline-5-carboxylate reductase [Hyphomonas johnsonii MHS-2]